MRVNPVRSTIRRAVVRLLIALSSLAILGPCMREPAATAAEVGEWPMPAKDYASFPSSVLAENTAGNARNLKVAFTFETGVLRGHEGAELVVNNTMYIVTPYTNYLYALDLTKPGAPMKWRYNPRAASTARQADRTGPRHRTPAVARLLHRARRRGQAIRRRHVRCRRMGAAILAGQLDPRDSTSALGFVNAMKDLPRHSTKGGTLYVFSL